MTPLLLAMERMLLEVSNTVRRDFVEIEHLQNTNRLDGFVLRAFRSVGRAMVKQLESVYPEDDYCLFPQAFFPPDEKKEDGKSLGGCHKIWHLFPVEGLLNFTHGLPFFCSSMCLMEEGEPYAAALMTPSLQHIFLAQKGRGTYRGRYRIQNKEGNTLHNSPVGLGQGLFLRNSKGERPSWRMSGSSLFDLTMVAAGFFKGAASMYAPCEEALEPGYLLIREAGNVLLPCRDPDQGIVVSSQGCVHHLRDSLEIPPSKTKPIKTPFFSKTLGLEASR